jgi:crossover junction endodeoxyribonuclease RuvC
MRILAFDTSLSCPGAAVLDYDPKKRTVKVIAVSHTKTNDKDPYAIRGAQIEHWAHLFARAHQKRGGGYDVIVREAYAGTFGHHSMFSAWAGVDRGLNYIGLAIKEKPIGQSKVKKQVVGKGKAEKEEVAEAVRKLTGYEGEFATFDESDAVAVALAYLLLEGMIEHDEVK